MSIKRIIRQKLSGFWQWIISTSWNKRAALLVVVFIIVYFLLKNIFLNGSSEQYSFDTVEKGNVSQLITVNGNVIAANTTEVFSPTNGILEEIFVKNGDKVAKGDALCTVRSTATPQEQAASYASYQSALNTLNTAQNTKLTLDGTMWAKQQAYLNAQNEQNYKNNNDVNPATGKGYTNLEKQSIDSSVVQTQKDFAAAEQAYKTADVAIVDGKAQVASTFLAYESTQRTTITAPIGGIVYNLIGLKGAKVDVQSNNAATSVTFAPHLSMVQSQSSGTITPVLIIGNDVSEYTITTAVSEVYADKVKLGQPATILFNGITGKKYKGEVIQVDTYGTNTQGIITYKVFVAIDTIDHNIKPNMSAILTINTDERKDVLTAANAAIITHEGEKVVQVVNKDREVDFIPVTVGLRGNTRSEILSGVDEGTKIIMGNSEFIKQKSGSFSLGE